tara:strand:- start:72 stop:626 length:555 start_codon:yes stop_codon:yes gene_type:complete
MGKNLPPPRLDDNARTEALVLWETLPKNNAIVRPAQNVDVGLLESGNGCFVQGWTQDAAWWNLGLVYGGVWIGANLSRAPHMRNFLARLPYRHEIIIAGISVLGPGASIPLHHDEPPERRGAFRVHHYGLFGEGTLWVGGAEGRIVRPGDHLSFDDADDHSATNVSTVHPRGILYVKRRLRNPK